MTRTNLAIVASYTAVGLAGLALGAFPLWSQTALWTGSRATFALTLGAIVLIQTQRSRRPLLALGCGAVVVGLDAMSGASLGVVLIFTDLIYCAVNLGSTRAVRWLVKIFVGLVAAVAATLLLTAATSSAHLAMAVTWALVIVASGAWGWNVRAERLRTQAQMAAQHTTDFLARQRDLAHDLHDLVANQIAVAGLHIEAARLLADAELTDTARLQQSLIHAKGGTEAAHRELRTLIGVLTASVDQVHPGPGAEPAIANLIRLVPHGRELRWAAGAEQTLTTRLDTAGADQRDILIRVLTELVTNAAKHGRGNIHLDVAADRAGLRVAVTNATAQAPAPSGNAMGLTGARQLLAKTGGQLVVTPAGRGDTWRSEITVTTPKKDRAHA